MVPFDIYSYCRRVRSSQTLHLQIQLFGAFAPATTSTDFLSKFLRFATSVAHDGHQQGSPQVSHMRFTSYPSDLRDAFPFQNRVTQFWPSLPVVPPQIRFLYVELTLCYQLPSSVCYLPDCAESLDLPLTADFQHVRCLHTNENPVDEKPPTGLRIRDPDQMLLTAPSPAPHPS